MNSNPSYRRFADLSVSEILLNSVFLCAIGCGYVFALANLYYTHQGRDGKPGLSMDDIVIAYHGADDKTRLESALNGIMEPNLRYKSDKDVIVKWIHAGADESGYRNEVAPILARDCQRCHSPDINPGLPDLTSYQGVLAVAKSGGASLPALIRVSHIHLFGIAFILYFIGKIFVLSEINVFAKRALVVIPFLAMFIDVFSWFVTKQVSWFSHVVVLAGVLMGMSMGAQIIISLYQMWFHRSQPPFSGAM
ncbi:hypothetical protein [Methylogaea oryzae]|uniref:Elongation factor-1 alpha n=1 Tax=Methylogaea oryzae TaxID=1295382 RepID=A0A8D4VLL7_9GAMM|nr:hypothetical protein [Methylogaea oryzae]BBL70113.1 hypothetical protein MoryE10_07190 [Methylogaea oryzae]